MADYRYSISPSNESLLDRLGVAKHVAKLQNRAKSLHVNQVGRWWKVGVRGIRLPSILIAGKKFSSVEAIEWWIQATTAADEAALAEGNQVAAPLTPEEQRVLEGAGITAVGA